MPAHRIASFPALLAAACVLPNPDFDPNAATVGETTTTTSSSSPTITLTGESDTTTTTTTTGVEPTTGDDTTTGTDTADATSTGADTDTDTDTGEPLDCWGLPPDDWTSAALPDAKLGIDPTAPHVSPDGLRLYYMASESEADSRWIFKSTRASVDAPFEVGAPLVTWPAFPHAFGHPNVTLDETEIILAVTVAGQETDVGYSAHNGATFPAPAIFAAPPNTAPYDEDIASISEDGARMIVQRSDGPANELLSTTWSFVEVARPAYPEPGTIFGAPAKVALPPITDSPGHVILCPTLAPDGLHLFFGSTYPVIPNQRESAEILKVFSTSRATLDSPWEAPVELTSLADDDPDYQFETCPTSVTRDGCQLFVHRFQFGPVVKAEDGYRIVVATRTP